MNTTRPLRITLLTAATALLCTGLQLLAIDTIAIAGNAPSASSIVHLPQVLVSQAREPNAISVTQLPQVMVVGHRMEHSTAQTRGAMLATES